ncbi:hypothetical protein NQ317_010812 [Molorchus minor]|uniref:Uncharacterized protein n=1 Tax=Molorchus minor TaxID=1323400 RepID=A0ABQ9JQP4_9CUCU|nr:hypothetical protein NQ317_010812 [Molorchus minor]
MSNVAYNVLFLFSEPKAHADSIGFTAPRSSVHPCYKFTRYRWFCCGRKGVIYSQINSMGCILLVVYGVQILWNSYSNHRQSVACFVMLLLATGCLRTVVRNRDWRSRESLLRAGLLTLPHNAKMHYNYANFLRDSNRPELAKSHYHRSLKLWPTYASAHNNLGTLLSDDREAEQHFLAAIKYSADHVNAHYNLGQLYRRINRSSDSEHMLKRCIALEPRFTPAYIELVKLRGPNDRSISQLLKQVVELNPTDPYYGTTFGHWLRDKGMRYRNHVEALLHYWKSLRISPSYQEAIIGAAKLLIEKIWTEVPTFPTCHEQRDATNCPFHEMAEIVEKSASENNNFHFKKMGKIFMTTCFPIFQLMDSTCFIQPPKRRASAYSSTLPRASGKAWQLIMRIKKGNLLLSPHVYLQGWQLKSELSSKAKAYDNSPHFESPCLSPSSKTNNYSSEEEHVPNKWVRQGKNKTSGGATKQCKVQEKIEKPKPSPPFMVHHILDSA